MTLIFVLIVFMFTLLFITIIYLYDLTMYLFTCKHTINSFTYIHKECGYPITRILAEKWRCVLDGSILNTRHMTI